MKRLLFFVALIVTSISTSVAQQFNFSSTCSTGQTLYYRITEDNNQNHYVSIVAPNDYGVNAWTGYTKPTGVLLIPTTVTNEGITYTVNRLESSAFAYCDGLTMVTIPNSVTSYGDECFTQCTNLSSINWPTSAITDCGWSIVEGTAWYQNQPNGPVYTGSVLIKYKGEVPVNTTLSVREGTTIIGPMIFGWNGANIVSLQLPSSLKKICYYTFMNIGAITVSIPAAVESIDRAFTECNNLQNFIVDENNQYFSARDGLLCSKNGEYLYQVPAGRSGTLTIPDCVKYIDEGEAFRILRNVSSIHLGSGVERISCALNEYMDFQSITVNPENQYFSVEDNVLYDKLHTKLVLVTKSHSGRFVVPNTVTEIGRGALHKCENITEVVIPPTVTVIRNEAFANTGIRSIYFPDSIERLEGGTCANCAYLTQAHLPANCKYIENSVFENSPLTSIVIPDSVQMINCNAFSNNSNLQSIVIGASVNDLGNGWCFPFWNDGITSVRCRSMVPPLCTSGEFPNEVYPNATLVVPCGTLSAYQSMYPWSRFNNMQEDMVETFVARASDSCMGMGEVVISHPYSCTEATATIIAVPFTGYHFVGWADGLTVASREVSMTDTNHYYANFAIDYYMVSIASNNTQYGVIDTTVNGYFPYGTQITVTCTPAEACYFMGWSDGNTDASRTFWINGDTNITANFDLIHSHIVVYSESYMGSVIGAGDYLPGDTIVLTAIPTAAYHFTGWSDGDTNNPRTLNVEGDTLLYANYEINYYNFQAISANTTQGIITNSNQGRHAHGTNVYAEARTMNGYHLTSWSNGCTSNYVSLTLTSDTVLTASFDINTYNVTVQSNNSSLGTVTGGGTFTHGETYQISATPIGNGVRFAYWSDGSGENPRTITATSEVNWIAYFENELYWVNVYSNDENRGLVTGGGSNLPYGSQITLTAYPQSGNYFNYWSDGSTENPHTITVTGSGDLRAYFSESQSVPFNSPDFSEVVPSGQFLYFRIVDTVHKYVEIVHPMVDGGCWGDGWSFHIRPSGTLTIPETITHENIVYTIVRIGDCAFASCNLTSVNIEAPVDTIKSYGLFNNQIDTITLPNTLRYIMQSNFRNTPLRTIRIPSSVTRIDVWEQGGGDSTKTIIVDPGNTRYCAVDGVLMSKNQDTLMVMPCGKTGDYVMPNTIRYMMDNAIWNTNLSRLTYSDGMVRIDQGIYNIHPLDKVTFGRNVNYVNGDFRNGVQVDTLVLRNPVPPAESYNLHNFANTVIVVPCGGYEAYSNANGWSSYSSQMVNNTEPIKIDYSVTIEYGDSYSLRGETINQRGLYLDTIQAVNVSCDSVVNRINLNVERHTYVDVTLTPGNTYFNGDIMASLPGVYSNTIATANYDSIVVARVSYVLNTTGEGFTTLASNIDATWIDLDNRAIFTGDSVNVRPTEVRRFGRLAQTQGTNLITNGDFEQDNSIFTSHFLYRPVPYDLGDGTYYIGGYRINNVGGNHYFYAFNYWEPRQGAPYETTVSVEPNTWYVFSFRGVTDGNGRNASEDYYQEQPPLNINGELVGTENAVYVNNRLVATDRLVYSQSMDMMQAKTYSYVFYNQNDTALTIKLNVLTDETYNFAYDDITLMALTVSDTITISNSHQLVYTTVDTTINEGVSYNSHTTAGVYNDTIVFSDYDSIVHSRVSMVINSLEGRIHLGGNQMGEWQPVGCGYSLGDSVVVLPMQSQSFVFLERYNLIPNGDFESGIADFNTMYTNNPDVNGRYEIGAGYGIDNSYGVYMDAATEPGKIFYMGTYPMEAGHTYEFFYQMKPVNGNPPTVQITLGDTMFYDYPYNIEVWQTFTHQYTAVGGMETLEMLDLSTEYWGNDFYLDNISLIDITPGNSYDTITITNRHQLVYDTLHADICQGDTITVDSIDFYVSGTYTLPVHYYSDSTVYPTLELSVHNNYNLHLSEGICVGDSYSFGNRILTTAGVYYDSLQSAFSCDSVVTLTLSVYNHSTSLLTEDVCDSFVWLGMLYTASTTAHDTIANVYGCDSICTLNLTVRYSTAGDTTADVCDPFNWYGQDYTTSGTPTHTLTNAVGCDSLLTLNLTVRYGTTGSETMVVCDSVTWHGTLYSASGNYNFTMPNAVACDSVITLHLTVNPTYQHTDAVFACDNQLPYLYHNQPLTTAGEHPMHFLSAQNCDSTVIVTLTVGATYQHTDQLTLCQSGMPYSYGNITFMEDDISGIYNIPFLSEEGCDSIINLDLTVHESEATEIYVVTVQATNNLVIWEPEAAVDHYNVYRESSTSGVYTLAAEVPFDEGGMWLDTASDARMHSYRYRMTSVDSCGVESPQSPIHRTMHLTINQGVGNSWNLVWTEYQGTTYSTYRIYRGASYDNMQLIGEIPSDNTTFTDNNAPEGYVYYQIVVLLGPGGAKDGNDGMIRSNVATNDQTGIAEVVNDGSKIIVEGRIITVESAVGENVQMFDVVGRRLDSTMSTGRDVFEASSSGVYFIKIGSRPARRVVVMK